MHFPFKGYPSLMEVVMVDVDAEPAAPATLEAFFRPSTGPMPAPSSQPPLAHLDLTKTYYEILGVQMNAPKATIKAAWIRMTVKYHPDKAGDAFTVDCQRLQHIYEILTNAGTRKAYDRDHTSFPFPGDPKPKASGPKASGPKAKASGPKAHKAEPVPIVVY